MNNNYIMTRCMFPLSEKKKILNNIYFDNPRNIEEVKKVAQVLKEANYSYSHFPENYKQVGEGDVSLEYIKDMFYKRYNDNLGTQTSHKNNKYKNIYYHLAKNWVIMRINNGCKNDSKNFELQNFKENSDIKKTIVVHNTCTEHEKVIRFINLLTFISLENDNFLDHSILLSECFDPFNMGYYGNVNLKSIIIDLLVMSTNISSEKDEPNEFRFCSFDLIYEKLKQNEKLLINKLEDDLIIYISNNLELYRQLNDDKMKIVSLVSMIEFLIAHNLDSSRYNIEDSIRKQFSNKIMVVLHLNGMVENPNELEKLLLLIYDLRSSIAHGSFDKISNLCEKIYKWQLKNDKDFVEYEDGWDEFGILNDVNILLRKYFRIIVKNYLLDEQLFQILKK